MAGVTARLGANRDVRSLTQEPALDEVCGRVDQPTSSTRRFCPLLRLAKEGFGELELGVREGTAAWLDAKSKFGTVRTHLEGADEPKPSDETVEVRARTGYGDIVIRRSTPAL